MFEGHFIEYVCWWELVCELSATLHYLYSCFIYFESEMSDLLLGTLGHCPFHHYIHYWCDFTPCLIWVDHHFSSYIHYFTTILIIACDSAHSLHLPSFFSYTDLFQGQHFLCIIITHLIISLIFFTASLLLSYSHWASLGPWLMIFYTCCISYIKAWVLIIGYLSLVSFHFYCLITLAYVTSRVLRPPWGHGIRCRLWQPLLGQVFEIWLIFRYHHTSSSRRRLFDVWTRFSCGFGLLGSHIWWRMIWGCPIFRSITHLMSYWGMFPL